MKFCMGYIMVVILSKYLCFQWLVDQSLPDIWTKLVFIYDYMEYKFFRSFLWFSMQHVIMEYLTGFGLLLLSMSE